MIQTSTKYMHNLLVMLFSLFLTFSFAQSPNPINGSGPYTNMLNCTGTPTFSVNLTGNPAGTWTSNPTQRAGSCCVPPDNNCVQFTITLDPAAEGIIFSIPSGCGASPSGALFYQVNCGPLTSVGTPLCLNGTGPFILTFCKPGSNTNCYSIQSIPAPASGGNVITADGCQDTLTVMGVTQASTTWTSLSPGTPGQYNNYLNNLAGTQPGVSGAVYTGQTTVIVTPQVGFPSVIQYRVCGTVVGGCSSASFCDTVSVSIFPSLFAQINPINPSICFGSAGTTLTAVPIGGTAPFNYLWNGPSNNGATSSTILASLPGVYTLTITDATGCPAATTTVTVTQFANTITANAGPNINICRSPIPTIAIAGSVTGVATGIWSGGAGTYSPSNTSLTLNYTPTGAELAAGTVTLTLTTTNNGSCPGASDQVVITLPQFTSVLTVAPTNITCNGLLNGAVNLTVTGGFATSSYLWSNGPVTQDISGVGPGTYTVTVTDINGCRGVISQLITQPAVLTSVITAQTNVSCFGGNNGSVTVAGAGGTLAYQFSINGGPNQASGTFSGLIAGAYTVTITDANGCIVNQLVTITQPAAALSLSFTQVNVLCFGLSTGSINLTPAGGTAPYTYSWSNGAITQDLSGLPAGVYTVNVTDANGLTAGCAAITTATITQPAAPLTLSSTQVNVLCNGGSTGSIDLTPSGGTAPYTYSWSNGAVTQDLTGRPAGVYTVNVTDANGITGSCAATATITITQPAAPLTLSTTFVNVLCNGGLTGSINLTPAGGTAPYTYLWSNGAVTQDLSGLAAGTYTVVVNDANGSTGGCTATTTVTITQPLAPLTLSFTQTNVLCFGASTGSINLTPAGGTAPYTYLWSNGAISQDLNAITAGVYSVVVNDVNGSTGGCTNTVTVTITQPAAPLTLSSTQVNVLCNGGVTGSIDLIPAGGTAPYTYSWSNGAITQDLSGLAAGVYAVNVTDANGIAGSCAATATITITQPAAPLTLTSTRVNVLCNGGLTGSIDLTPAGGTAPYTYSWSNGAITQDLSGLAAGTYTVVVNDANGSTGGCTATATIIITQPAAPLTVTATQTNVLCNGALTGAINITPVGGTVPYTYAWSNGAVIQDLTGIAAGTYTVVINDANGSTGGCTATITLTITQPAAPLTLSSTQVNILCNGGVTGSIDLTPAGGTAPYTYLWSNGSVTQDLSGLAAGVYTVNVNDANGIAGSCAATTTITITQPLAPLTLTSTRVNVLCNGGLTGSIDLTPAGGTAPYTYLWSNGAITQDLSGLAAGTYTVVVNDVNGSTGGCTATATIIITQPAAPLTVTATQTNVLCNGALTGAINITPVGGTVPYTYAWSNGAVTQDLTGIAAGTFTVVINDANGSTGGCTATITLTITQPAAPLTLAFTQTNVLCNGSATGAIDLTPAGGTAPYTYSWSNGAVTQDLSGLAAGVYTVNVNDANGLTGSCANTLTVTITQPLAPLTVTSTSVNVLCFGALTGSINITPAGGTIPYTYAWSNGAVTQDLTGIAAGVYTVNITDANGVALGCAVTTTVTITQPAAALAVSTTQVNVLCNGSLTGSINMSTSGGTTPYTYLWSNGAITEDISGLAAGVYSVVVNDANGVAGTCSATTTVTITQPAAPLTLSFTQTNVLCNGALTGAIDITPAGGTAPYFYTWSNGATTQDISGLAAGVYTVNVRDANGVVGGCFSTVTVTITQPTALTQTISAFIYPSGTNISCFGLSNGSVNLTIGGGASGYSYSWSNGSVTEDLAGVPSGTYNVIVTDLNGCIINSTITLTQPVLLSSSVAATVYVGGFNLTGCANNGAIDLTVLGGNPGYTYSWSNGAIIQDISALAAGAYTVNVTDINGCITSSTITLTQPTPLTQGITAFVYPSGTNISCFGLSDGSIDLTIGGGTPLYSYLWSNGATTQDLANVPVGVYNVTVTDANGCTITSTITLTQPVLLSTALVPSVYAGGFNVSGCVADGTIDLTVAGGNPGYTYSWSNGAVIEDINSLIAGTYIVTVTDINGCQSLSTITLTQPGGLTQTITATSFLSGTNISCFGLSDGNIDLTIGGGSPGYTYLWNTGATTQDLTNVPAGTYNVVVTDLLGCQISSSITLTQPPALTQTIAATVFQSGTNISCFGLSNGNVDLTIIGGNPGYIYTWSNGAITQDLSNVPAGVYNVTVVDVNGCTIPSTITLIQPTILTQTVTSPTFASGTNISCFGLSDGNVDLTIGGGNPGYTYSWSNGSVTQDLSNIPAGTYNVTVTDVNGCVIPSTITLTQPAALTQTITSPTFASGNNISCFGLSDGNVDLTIGGGNPGYIYSWSNGSVIQDLTGIVAGTYSVIVTDVNGCSIPSTITLTQPTALTEAVSAFIYPSGTNISCFGLSDGSVNLTVNGGSPGYVYAWSNGAVTQDLAGIPSGTYNVTITDINGCTIPSTITLTQPTILTSNVVPFVYPGGFNVSGCLPDGSINLTVLGGSPGYTYSWSNGSNNEDISLLPAGAYSVTTTDLNGCQTTSAVILTQPIGMTQTITAFTYPSGTNISCIGLSDGSINLTIGGGVGPYTYSWSNGAITEDLTNVPFGTYNVTATDQNGCIITSTITLTQPTALTQAVTAFIYPSGTNISCFGLSDGSIDLTIGNGSPGYTYLWSNGATTQDLVGIPVGTYTVITTDLNGCTIPSTFTIVEPTPLTESINATVFPSGTNISCFGFNDGNVNLTIGGGSPGYTYTWSNGATTQDLNALIAGIYNVTVTDINGCTIPSTITLTEPPILTQTISSPLFPSGSNISCFGLNDGSVDLTIGGGNPGYTYSWSNSALTEDISTLIAGTYSVVVTDINGCVIPSTITLTEPTPLAQSITAFTYPSGTNISCFGLSDGSIDLTIGNGSPGYTYLWSNGATTQDLVGLPVGIYTVLTTDLNGCTIPSTFTLVEPTPLTENVTAATFLSGTNISCFGFNDGSVDLTIGGGSPGYSYVWSNGSITEDLNALTAGIYNVTVTDINGCTIPSTITLTEPPILTQTISSPLFPSGSNISCFGMNDGSVDLTIGGGNPGYTYSWSNSAITQDISTLIAGTYSVVVTDINGCVIPSTITLTEPTPLAQSITAFTYPSGTNISCFGLSDGSIDFAVLGGSPVYTYLWSNGATTEDLIGLPAGTYSVVATDANGCIIPSTITLVEPTILTESISAFTYPSGNNISCFGFSDGSVDVSTLGGSPVYTFLWNTGATTEDLFAIAVGTYTVTATDINGCTINSSITLNEPTQLTQTISGFTYPSGTNISCFGLSDGSIDLTANNGSPGYTYVWSNGALTQDISGLPAGIYNVMITDLNGCLLPSTITLVEPPALTQGITAFSYPSGSNISCFGLSDGSIDLTINGGNPGYSYLWSTGAITQDIVGLPAGNYTVDVVDINGCTIPSTITLVEPTILTQLTSSPTFIGGNNISCFGLSDGSIDLSIGGGSPGYTYVWSTGALTEDIAGLPIGTYNVTATDINGCQINGSIILTEPTPLTYTQSISLYSGGYNVTGCVDDGTIDLSVFGSIPGYFYTWSNGAPTEDLSNLAAGNYSVTIADANGCQLIVDTTLVAAPIVTAVGNVTTNYSGQDISCFGASDGGINVTPGGGAPGYTYQWSDAANAPLSVLQNPIGLPSGLYNVIVTDQNGCTAATTVTLIDPPAYIFGIVVSTNYNGQDISCFGASDGGIDLTVAGATPGYSYSWTDNGGTVVSIIQDPTGLPAGVYDVLTTDANGCTFSTAITLTEPPLLMSVPDVTSNYNGADVSCYNSTDGSLTVIPSGGTPGYTYQWTDDNGTVLGSNINQNNVGEGIYQVLVTDVNGCTVISPVVVTQPEQLLVSPILISNYFGLPVSCEGATDGMVQAFVTGGIATYNYTWNTAPVSTTAIVGNLGTGTYTIDVVDANGCIAATSVTLTANPLPTFSLPPVIYGCIGDDVILNSNADPGSSCQWVFSDGQIFNDCGPFTATFSGNDCFDLQYTVANSVGCFASASMTDFMCIQPTPVANFYADEYDLTNIGSSTNFWNTSTGASSYIWNFGDGTPNETGINEYHEFLGGSDTGTTNFLVTLYAISDFGCIDSTFRYITMNPEILIYVPNTFTPDGDEYNNEFFPVITSGISMSGYTLFIFNRWGEMIFESHDISVGWDGTYNGALCQDGTYTWKIIVKNVVNDKKYEYVGHVNLLR